MPATDFDLPDAADRVAEAVSEVYQHTRDPGAFRLCCEIWWCTLTRYQPGQEERYLELVGSLPKPAVMSAAKGFGVLLEHFCHSGHYCDVLGAVYMRIRSSWGGKVLGQYFTPWSLCMAMAKSTMDGPKLDQKVRRREDITVCDPCIGSGSTILAAKAVVAEKYGRWCARLVKPHGQDIDELCVLMAKIQLTMTDDQYMRDLLICTHSDMKAATQ